MPKSKEQCYCSKCGRTMNAGEFYQSNNLQKYPTKYLNQCKKCITMHVDNWKPETYLWILQEVDVPYIPEEWYKLLSSYGTDRSKMKGTTIIGRYLSKMKLSQWNKYRWKDSDFLQERANAMMEQAMQRQGFDIQQITQAKDRASFDMPTEELEIPKEVLETRKPIQEEIYAAPPLPGAEPEDDSVIDSYITDEERLEMRLKWGKTYKPEEWAQLEKLYDEMMSSYDIQSAGHIDTLKMICKTSLKANQLLDLGDVDGAQKMVKMYDMLMKSGKFILWTMKNFASCHWGFLFASANKKLTGKPKSELQIW